MTEKEEAVQRMQDYIAAHLTERITLADLSEAACYSPWYSARLFKELTGCGSNFPNPHYGYGMRPAGSSMWPTIWDLVVWTAINAHFFGNSAVILKNML